MQFDQQSGSRAHTQRGQAIPDAGRRALQSLNLQQAQEVVESDLAIVSALATAHVHILKDTEARGRLLELGCTAECASLPIIPIQTYELGNQYGPSPVSPKHEALARFGYQIHLLKRSLEAQP